MAFYVRQRYGGPTIDFSSPVFAEIEENRIGPGSISIYPYYYVTNERFCSSELKSYYDDFTKFIKKMCVKVKVDVISYWIGNDTFKKAIQKKYRLISNINKNILELAIKQNKNIY